MLKITCHECSAQYRVDETKIKGNQAKFRCSKCSKMVEVNLKASQSVVESPAPSPFVSKEWGDDATDETSKETPFDTTIDDLTVDDLEENSNKKPEGVAERFNDLSIGAKLLIMFLANVLIIGGTFAIIYMSYIPALLKEQINLRTYSVAQSFSAAVIQPFLLKNYLRINQTAELISKLPGVAYASVVNKRGIAVAGIFGQKDRFDKAYIEKIATSGFPKELNNENRIPHGKKESTKDLFVGGRNIIDVAIALDNSGGEVHVGMFTEDIQRALKKSLIPLAGVLLIITVLGSLGFIFMAKTVSKPIQALISAAEKISVGDLESPIDAKGGREINALAKSLERMRFSIHFAINRLRTR